MIQRFIFYVIEQAIAALIANPDLLDDLFVETLGLSQEECDAIKASFAAKPPTLAHGYARSDSEFPLISITLGGENGLTTYLGDDAIDEDEGDDEGEEAKSKVWDHSFPIYCYAQHPDITTYLYEIVKQAMALNTEFFASKNLWDIGLAGADLAPDPRYAPEVLFMRVLTFRCNDEFKVVKKGSLIGKAFKVSGIHVDNSGSPRDVGDVKTNVKVR